MAWRLQHLAAPWPTGSGRPSRRRDRLGRPRMMAAPRRRSRPLAASPGRQTSLPPPRGPLRRRSETGGGTRAVAAGHRKSQTCRPNPARNNLVTCMCERAVREVPPSYSSSWKAPRVLGTPCTESNPSGHVRSRGSWRCVCVQCSSRPPVRMFRIQREGRCRRCSGTDLVGLAEGDGAGEHVAVPARRRVRVRRTGAGVAGKVDPSAEVAQVGALHLRKLWQQQSAAKNKKKTRAPNKLCDEAR